MPVLQWFADINNIWAVPLYPLIGFALIVLYRWLVFRNDKQPPKEISMLITVFATFLGLLHSIGAVAWLFEQPGQHVQTLEQNWTWLQAGTFSLSLGYLVDPMAVMMLFVVTFISLLIQIYTHGYMNHDAGYNKFYAYLALFNFSMLGLVLSTNLFQIYIFWELVGVSSYLLIGFWFTRPSAAGAAIKAFLMNRVGDFGLLIGILAFLYFGFDAWQAYLAANPGAAMLSFAGLSEVAPAVLATAGPGIFAVIALLIFMGPMAKSAQLPLHTWLPDAMEGPTPISALIHAATMVAAGVYLIGRVYPIFTLSEPAMLIVAVIGTLTAIVAATIALTQFDIKKALAYSTMSQLGFMVAAMGVGAFSAGLFHLFTHAFFKAMLFLCSGSVIHACEDEQDMRKMGGLLAKLPVTGFCYLIGTVAISGLFWTSGFWSKDEILIGAEHYSAVLFWTLTITAGLTSFYMFRTFFLTFWGEYRGKAHVHKESWVMGVPLMVLAIPSLFIGWYLSGVIHDFPSFVDYIHFAMPGVEAAHHDVAYFSPVGNLSMAFGMTGLILAVLFYATKAFANIPEQLRTTPGVRPFYALFAKKYYFDELYQNLVDRVYMVFAYGSARFDSNIIDGLVGWTGKTVVGSGAAMRQMQSGLLPYYVATLFFGVVVLALAMYYWML